ncbi:flagellar hook-associated protein 2 [Jeotgalibacillus proteolyticus]|uniref:Flagellar hook-associated protein 2 n=1 Tax=Jeotgalibacillus proteolyticus TaxID=2082395 RepID=A0A2S5GB71_9BACL|nr:flagellar hook-associated protein 2 [Jeotgalibacillus proteolyticus]PPA70239.1 flagellar cap protein FliD [Jeotgalibacillus proteolyticus]
MGMRVHGLASGMDVDSIVKQMMNASRIPLDKLNQQKQYMEWQRDNYRDLNRKLNDFSNLVFDTVLRPATFAQKTVTTTSSDVSIRSLTATGDMSGTIRVSQLSRAANMKSAEDLKIDPAAKLDSKVTGEQTITIQTINADGVLDPEGYTLTFDPSKESLNSVIDKINKNSNVNMFYDSFTKAVSLSSKQSGRASGDVEIKLTGDFFTNTLMLDEDNRTAEEEGRGLAGQNAKFTYNGLETERLTNKFQLNGFEFTLSEATNKDVQFSSSPNTEKILESIVKFTDEYNKLIEEIQKMTKEVKYRDFPPLTDAQRSELTEKEAEMWDEKAKSGTLRSDPVLNSALSKMRQDLYSTVSGLGGASQLAQIGITTSNNYLDGGKLVINEDKLRAAITENPTSVYDLFAKDSTNKSEQGLGRRLRETIASTRNDIITRAGRDTSAGTSYTLGRNLENMNDQIKRFENRLTTLESRYYKQFTAMEVAIQKANSQSAYLMNAFSSGM